MSRQLSAYCDRPSQELGVCPLFPGPLWRCTWLVKGAKAPAGLLSLLSLLCQGSRPAEHHDPDDISLRETSECQYALDLTAPEPRLCVTGEC